MKKKQFKWILVIVWMIVIFWFSSQPAEISDENNKLVIYIFSLLGLDLNGIFGNLANFIVRKTAHFSEYFIFYMLLYNALRKNLNRKKALLWAVVGVFLYACSDEFHQTFIPGREGRFRDVLIDTSGGMFASILINFKVHSKCLLRKKKEVSK